MHYRSRVTRYYCGINPVFTNTTAIVLFNEDSLAGRLYFEPNKQRSLTPHRFEDGCPVLYFYQEMMPQIIDLLRNEAPMWLWAYVINETQINNAVLSTDYYEPVGEGEAPGRRS